MNDPRLRIDRSAAVLGLVLVIGASARYVTGLGHVLDPMMSMDPYYIDMAQRPVAEILHGDPSWGPLYALWLKPFVALLRDPLRVYLANVCVLSVAVCVALYAHLLLVARRAAVAAAGSLLFLISDWNVPLDSKVSGFALLVVVAGFAAAKSAPAGARRMTLASAGVLCASYARPELFAAALLLLAATVWLARREAREAGRAIFAWPLALSIAFLAAAAWTGVPVLARGEGNDRLLFAFQEHFAWNWNRWHRAHAPLFSIWQQEFGAADTMLRAALSNPGAVAHHVGDNVLGTLGVLASSAFDHYPLLAPVTRPRWVAAENLLVCAGALVTIVAVAARGESRRVLREQYGDTLFAYAAVGMVCAVAAALVFPAPHYLALPCVLLMLTAALAVSVLVPAESGLSFGGRALVALACLAAIPRPFVVPAADGVAGTPLTGRIVVTRTVTDTVEFVRGLYLPVPVHVLTATDGIGALLGSGFDEVRLWQKGNAPLDAYMRARDVGLVINLEGGRDSFRVDDPAWGRFQLSPEEAGFTRLSVPRHEAIGVYVRDDLLAQAHRGATP